MNILKLIKSYYEFSKKELGSMVFLAFAAAFMMNFRHWGIDKFDAAAGISNTLNAFVIGLLAIFVHESAHKLYALHKGYVAEHKPWHFSVVFGLLLTLVTNGYLFFFGFGVVVYHLSNERLGKFRYQMNLKDIGLISVAGPLANLALAAFFKVAANITASPLAEKAVLINIWFAVFNMLPLPWVDGGNLFFAGRIMYLFFTVFIAVAALTIYLSQSVLVPLLFSLIIASAMAAFWAIYFEKIAGD